MTLKEAADRLTTLIPFDNIMLSRVTTESLDILMEVAIKVEDYEKCIILRNEILRRKSLKTKVLQL